MSSSRGPPTSPSRSSSRAPSINSPSVLQHAPLTPSGLRETHTFFGSPEDTTAMPSDTAEREGRTRGFGEARRQLADERTSLLKKPVEIVPPPAHAGPCNHGTFSPRIESPSGSLMGFGGPPQGSDAEAGSSKSMLSSLLENVGLKNGAGRKKMSTTSWLAERHGITNTTSMYVPEAPYRINIGGLTFVEPLLIFGDCAGTSLIIFPSLRGSVNTDGHICKAIS
jgi:hypothetical protein